MLSPSRWRDLSSRSNEGSKEIKEGGREGGRKEVVEKLREIQLGC